MNKDKMNEIKKLEIEIKKQEKKLEKLKNELDNLLKEVYSGNNKHILERFDTWLKSPNHESSEFIIDEGPLRDLIEESFDFDRHEDVYPIDIICNFLYDYGISLQSKSLKENIEIFEKLDEKTKEKITNVLEDAIKQNIDEFRWDW